MIADIKFADWFSPYCYPAAYKSLGGGRGSGKSRHIAQLAVLRMMLAFSDPRNLEKGLPYYPPVPVQIFSGRQFNISLGASVKKVMAGFITEKRLLPQFFIGNTQIVHKESGSTCLFQGIDRNTNNIRSVEGINIWWFEEAQFLTQEQMDIILPTIREWTTCPITGKKFPPELWCVWNPDTRSGWTWQRFVEFPMPRDLHRIINYYDNPWLPPNLLELANFSKENYPAQYEHVWLGKPNDGNTNEQILPYQLVRACIDAWERRPSQSQLASYNARTDMGVDIATGGNDKCAAVVRTGPVVHDIKLWNGSMDTDATAVEAVSIMDRVCEEEKVQPWTIYYDASTPMEAAFRNSDTPTLVQGINFGSKPGGVDVIWESDETNGDYFARRNIQMATAVRQRAHRTLKMVNGDRSIDPMDCLFINPEIEGLDHMISLMSMPIRYMNNSGKWEVDKRGGASKNTKSPDEFDALILAFADDSDYGLVSDRLF